MPFFLLLFFLLMVVYALLIDYYHKAWIKLPGFDLPGEEPTTVISVIIPVRNEEENIKALMESLYHQSYPKQLYQVIIVDDQSTDNTWSILSTIFYPGFETTAMQLSDRGDTGRNNSHKKRAIETGLMTARGTLIVTTDADCRFHTDWLKTIAAFYETTQAKFIAAPVTITAKKKSLLPVFQILDFITLQGITGAAVYKKIHSMCNGANLAYEKEAFIAVNGYEGIDDIPTGDDMLLMHKIYSKYPGKVFYLKNKEAIVTTQPALTWKAFFNQRIRWASKADRYDDKRIFWVLLLVYLVNVCFLVLGIAAFWKNIWLFFFCILLAGKILIEFPFVYTVARFFGQQSLMLFFPFLQPLHILYTIIAGWMGKFGSYNWKGRKINR